jgi:hypothetical protein
MEKELDMNKPLDKTADLERQLTESRQLSYMRAVRIAKLERALETIHEALSKYDSDASANKARSFIRAALRKDEK